MVSLPGKLETTVAVIVFRADETVVELTVAVVTGETVEVRGLPIEVPNFCHKPSKPPTLSKPKKKRNVLSNLQFSLTKRLNQFICFTAFDSADRKFSRTLTIQKITSKHYFIVVKADSGETVLLRPPL